MASGHTPTNVQLRRRFQRGLQILLDTFHDTILLYTQDIQVVNFSDIYKGYVNVIIMYRDVEGQSVKLEAVGKIDKDYVHTLDFPLASHEKSSPRGTKWLFWSFFITDPPYSQWFA